MTTTTADTSIAPRRGAARAGVRARRGALLAGRTAFVLTAALVPCINAIAATISDRAPATANAVAPASIAGRSTGDNLLTRPADGGAKSACCDLTGPTPQNAKVFPALPAYDSPSGGVAIAAVPAPFFPRLATSDNFAPHDAPSPPRRVYLRTLRLLI